MKKIIRYLSLSLGMVAFLCAFHCPTANAALVRLTPQHMYRWAKEQNTSRLNQFKRYINMMDEQQNTALCLAQQAKDKKAYSLLLDYGASTKAPCHDDNDPICAIIAGEKTKMHPAGWALLAAGAAAGAYLLFDDDDDKKCDITQYPLSDCPEHGICSNCKDKKKLEDCEENWVPNAERTKCLPIPCPTNEATSCPERAEHALTQTPTQNFSGDQQCYTCSYACDTSNGYYESDTICRSTNEGYTCTPSTNGCYIKGICDITQGNYSNREDCENQNPGYYCAPSGVDNGCWKKDTNAPKQCPPPAIKMGTCEAADTYHNASETPNGEQSGDDLCVTCSYTCKAGYYTNEDDCTSGGYLCTAHEQQSVTCYERTGDAGCPDPTYTKGILDCNDKAHPKGWTYLSFGQSGGVTCGKCEANTCNTGYTTEYQTDSDCPTTGTAGWDWSSDTYAGDLLCTKCDIRQCPNNANIEWGPETGKCPTVAGLTATKSEQNGANGENWCYTCTYDCDEITAFSSETSCKAGGYECSQNTVSGATCWFRGPASTCPAPYSTEYQSVTDCGSSKEKGYTYTSSGESGGLKCGICTPKTCPSPQDTTCEAADSYHTLSETESTTDFAGELPCKTCTYGCATGLFTTQTECETDGYTCTPREQEGKICYERTGSEGCPTDYIESLANCNNKQHPEGWTYTSTTVGGVTCGKCTPQTCNTGLGYTTTAQTDSDCPTTGTAGWDWSQDQEIPYAGNQLCTKCVSHACPSDAKTEWGPETAKCPTVAGLTATKSEQNGASGDQWCYTCAYDCDEITAFSSESRCKEGGYECSQNTVRGATCWFRGSALNCPAPYSTEYQSVEDCGSSKEKGYTYTSSGTSGGLKCGICTAKTCPNPQDTTCEAADSYHTLSETESTTDFAGELPCKTCTYGCATDLFIDELNCSAGGFTCTAREQGGKICYEHTGSVDCREGTQKDTPCTVDNTKYITEQHIENVGFASCYLCTYSCRPGEESCPAGKDCTEVQTPDNITCYQNPICRSGSYFYESKEACENENKGYTCTENATGSLCWIKTVKTCPTPSVEIGSCQEADSYHTLSEVETGEQAGTVKCVNCTYGCATGLFTTQTECETDGYTCTPREQEGKICYERTGSEGCPTDYIENLANCNSELHPQGWIYTSTTVGGVTCGKCTPQTCNTGLGYTTTAQTGSDCPTTGTAGWDWSQDQEIPYAGNQLCTKCVSHACPSDAKTEWGPETGKCPTVAGLTATKSEQNGASGDQWCYTCAYDCDEITAFSSESRCKEGGYECTQNTVRGATCWFRGLASDCPPYFSTDYPDIESCGTTGSKGWSWTSSGTSGGITCGVCVPHDNCPFQQSRTCEAADTYHTLSETDSTTGFIGEVPCKICTYGCKAGYYEQESDCTSGGYTCTPREQKGKICYERTGSADCPPNTYEEDMCMRSSDYETDTEEYLIGERMCYGCTYSCKSGTEKCPDGNSCDTITRPDGVNCYIEPECDIANGFYSTLNECLEENPGYDCKQILNPPPGATCYTKDTEVQCPTDYTLGLANCSGKQHPEGWTYTSTTVGNVTCGKCEANTCNTGYTTEYQTDSDCPTTGTAGWDWSSDTYAGDLLCTKCVAHGCPNNANIAWGPETGKCPKITGLTATKSEQNYANGENWCYTCTYDCDEIDAFSDSERCGNDCTEETIRYNNNQNSINCYVPSGTVLASVSKINKTSTGTEDVVGLSGNQTLINGVHEDPDEVQLSLARANNEASITITHNSTGKAYGIKGLSDNKIINENTGQITIHNNSTGEAYGMYTAPGGSADNLGNITITGNTGTAYGMYGEGQNTITNKGTIDVSGSDAFGIYVKDGAGSKVTNSGLINVNANGHAYGIYVDKNSANAIVSNTGKIIINNEERPGDTGITLNGAELHNFSIMRFSTAANLNSMGGSVYLEKGGVMEAKALSGDLNIGVSNVLGNNQNTYITESAIVADNIEDLNLVSESALFEASLKKNDDGTVNIQSDIKNDAFAGITPNSSIGNYLTENYEQGYLISTYDEIKANSRNEAAISAKKLGYNIMPNFADENFTVLKSLNRNIVSTLLTPTDEVNRVVAGADRIDWETDTKGLLSGSDLSANSMYTFGDKRLDNKNRLGLGLSFTTLSSNYDRGGDRDLNIVSIFVPYIHKFTDRLRLASIASIGYGYGEYDRGSNNESDLTTLFYGLTNELRYTIDLNGFAELEPALMLNAIGYHEDSYDEGNGKEALETKGTNNLSVEAGVGLFLKKAVKTEKYGKLGFKIGGIYYRELATPFKDIDARMKKGNTSWYRINDYANLYSHDRAILEAAIDYEYKQLGIYLKYNRLIQKNNPELFDLGVKYNF